MGASDVKYAWMKETDHYPASVGKIVPWGAYEILTISNDVPEGERDELAEKICNLLNENLNELSHLPINCRDRLVMELKPYPKSGCDVCDRGLLGACPYKVSK